MDTIYASPCCCPENSTASREADAGHDRIPDVVAIVVWTFDDVVGHRMEASVPNPLPSALRDTVAALSSSSDFATPADRPFRLVSIPHMGLWSFVGVVVGLFGPRYLRNICQFTVGFITEKADPVSTSLALDLGLALHALEEDTQIVSMRTQSLQRVLHRLRAQLKTGRRLFVRLSPDRCIARILRPRQSRVPFPRRACPNHVPIPLTSLDALVHSARTLRLSPLRHDTSCASCLESVYAQRGEQSDATAEGMLCEVDLALQQMIPYIDGVSPIRQIAIKAQMDEHYVKLALDHFAYFGFVVLQDMFSLSNIYLRDSADQAVRDTFNRVGRQKAVHYLCDAVPDIDQPIVLLDILHLYQAIPRQLARDPTKTVCVLAFYEMYRHVFQRAQISLRHFIAFGQIHRLLRRVHEYPTAENRSRVASSNVLLQLADGRHSLDFIAAHANHFCTRTMRALLEAEATAAQCQLTWRYT